MNSLSIQYLTAMGIESWELRNSSAEQNASASDQPSVAQEPSDTLAAVQHWHIEDIEANLERAKIVFPHTPAADTSTDVLVITEGSGLSPQGLQLLSSMMKAIQLDINDQLLGELVGDANEVSSTQTCGEVIRAIKPRVVLLMAMLDESREIGQLDSLRSKVHRMMVCETTLAVSLHPAVLLDNPDAKRPAWEDLKRLKTVLG